MSVERSIFKRGSTTYYFSSVFFPEPTKTDVFKLYSFVRVADDYVDNQPVQPEKLYALESSLQTALKDKQFDITPSADDSIDTRVVKNMVDLIRRYDFQMEWINAFFSSMKADIAPLPCKTINDTLNYTYGSAEVIGLMMSQIMRLPDQAHQAAIMQGRAMQFINFIRDIQEDNSLNRQYLPQEDMDACGLTDLHEQTAKAYPEAFAKFMQLQIDRYLQWQDEATRGFTYIPYRYRIPLRTAVDMYNWTALEIQKNPLIVFDKKVKPGKYRVLFTAIRRTFHA